MTFTWNGNVNALLVIASTLLLCDVFCVIECVFFA